MNSPLTSTRAEQQEIDASAKWPVLAFFGPAAVWLVVGSLFQIAANMQLHSPAFLADCAWTTHGRLAPAAQNLMVYGWGFNVAFGFSLWLMARLSATTLRHGGWLFVAANFWNIAVLLGVGGILGGYSRSFELLEMPRYVTLLMLGAYAFIGVWAVTTFSIRNTENVYASQWYIFGAAFWFPWLLSIAHSMLFGHPVRGVLQPIVNAWYVNGIYGLWFLPMALAAIYYLLPKLLGKPISNYYLAPLAFWWFVFCTALSAGSRLLGGPVPVWITTLGTVANMLLVLPLVVIALNFFGTLAGRVGLAAGSISLRFVLLGVGGFFLSSLLGLALSTRGAAVVAQFTALSALRDWLSFYACFSAAMFGAAYFLLPRLTGRGWRSSALVQIHFYATAVGALLLAIGYAGLGWQHGHLLADATVPFATVTDSLTGWHTFNSLGLCVLLLGHAAFLINVVFVGCPLTSPGSPEAAIPVPPTLVLAGKEGHA